ncbi:MAG TPA: PAS domain S-box protein [Candidatus Hydrogenedentes bacterium]|nr:PAS domain S-box protein [Candidatus Hydrogenedentota bacterium]
MAYGAYGGLTSKSVSLYEEDTPPSLCRFISWLEVVVALLFLLAVGFLLLFGSPSAPEFQRIYLLLGVAGAAVHIVAAILARLGMPKLGIAISIFLFSILVIGISFSYRPEPYWYWTKYYLAAPVFQASVAFRKRTALLVTAAICAGLALNSLVTRTPYVPIPFLLVCAFMVLSLRMVSEQFEAIRRKELAVERSRYQELLETAFDGYALLRGRAIIDSSRGFRQLFGLSKGQSEGLTVNKIISLPFDRLLSGRTRVTTATSMDGKTLYIEYAIRPVSAPGMDDLEMIAIRDVTRREEDARTLRQLFTTIEQAAEAVIITDPSHVITYVNPAFCAMSGWSCETIIGKTPRVLQSGRHDRAFYQELHQTIMNGRAWHGRFENRRKDGQLYHLECTISPVCDDAGNIINFVAIGRDITRELKLEEQYRHAQKMEAVGQLAGGVAHDFNNMLQAIRGYTELIQMGLPRDHALQRDVNEILASADRAANIVKKLLAFSRTEALRLERLDINEAIRGVVGMLGRLLGEHVELHLKLTSRPLWVDADRNHLEQVLVNLAVNARDAMPRGGTLSIRSESLFPSQELLGVLKDMEPRTYVVIEVSDTGEGMTRDVLEHIFEPFFTTKEVGKGTGLGLATVYGIIRQHQGLIEAKSEPGQGASFRIYLPLMEEEPITAARAPQEQATVSPALPVAPAGRGLVLIAEDEPVVREWTRSILESSGFSVVAASNGEEALLQFQANADKIILALLDVVMPRRNGVDVARQISAVRPDLPVIFMTGHDFGMLEGQGAEDGQSSMPQRMVTIQKPFHGGELLQKVRETLSALS